jgi:predicted acylesterase/phospholipase RssA
MIECLVFSGGLYHGFKTLGIINYLLQEKFIIKNEVLEIVGSSVGSIIGILILLDIPYIDSVNYFIQRPWHKSFKNIEISNLFIRKGIFDIDIFKIAFKNLFEASSLNIDITLLEFYTITKIKYTCVVYNTTTQELNYFNYENTPDLKVLEAIYASCSIPIIFEPYKYKDVFYTDGLMLTPFPINYAIDKYDSDKIVAIQISELCDDDFMINEEDNIISFLMKLFNGYRNKYKYVNKNYNIKYLINSTSPICVNEVMDILTDESSRRNIYEKGLLLGKEFFDTHNFVSTNLLNDV